MANDVSRTLRQALKGLQAERGRFDRQITALTTALDALNGRGTTSRSARRSRQMSAAARRAIGKRMKAYWAKRRAVKASMVSGAEGRHPATRSGHGLGASVKPVRGKTTRALASAKQRAKAKVAART